MDIHCRSFKSPTQHRANKDSGAALTNYDYNIIFKYGLDTADNIVIGERDENSSFTLQALDVDGIQIGNDVGFQQAYRWNTGYSDTVFPTQAMWFNLLDLNAFFHDGATEEIIYGLKVIIPGGADIKLLAGSLSLKISILTTLSQNQAPTRY